MIISYDMKHFLILNLYDMKTEKMSFKTLTEIKAEIEYLEWELKRRAHTDGFDFDLITICDACLIVIDEDGNRFDDYHYYLCRKFPKMSEVKELCKKVEALEGSYSVLYDTEARAWDEWSDRLGGDSPYPIGDSITITLYQK